MAAPARLAPPGEEEIFFGSIASLVPAGAARPDQPDQPDSDHPIRVRLLDAARRVFARQGYEGTRIMDIVREAGLSTGAVYGRFRSKNDLLRAAIVERAPHVARLGDPGSPRVAELIARTGRVTTGPLNDDEAVRLEAFVAARREPEVARALLEAGGAWRAANQPLVDAALADGTISADLDPEAVLFFLRTVGLGLLLQRAAGVPGPDPEAWDALVTTVVASFGNQEPRGVPE
jgi:AcrR family transcriptional regulator